MIKMSEDDFDAVIDTNLKGTFNTIKHMYRAFLKQRAGRIINLSSVSGVLGNAGQANYTMMVLCGFQSGRYRPDKEHG